MATRIVHVGLATDIKDFIVNATVRFTDNSLRDKIMGTPDNHFLRITKTIGSNTTIIDVVDVDDDFILKALGE